jgi:oxygen-independent coproporphyrinogen-3 oxidase
MEGRPPLIGMAALPPHLYLHVPFCASKCSYCDFFSVAEPAGEVVDAWLGGVVAQMRDWLARGLPGTIETVYVGGGTPSWSDAPVPLLAGGEADNSLPLAPGAEVTLEANPDSLDADALERARYLLVNRLSIGVQSFDDVELGMLGRRHDASGAFRAVETALASGFEVSIDLMCGLPGQSPESWERTLSAAVATGVSHVSVYPLTLETGTRLEREVARGAVPTPEADIAADMMIAAGEILGAAGLPRYEVSSYAAPGHESRHNLAYWTGRPYMGIGPGAHGMLDAATARAVGLLGHGRTTDDRVRYWYDPSFPGPSTVMEAEVEVLDADEAAREDVMLGMRLVAGVAAEQVADAGLEGVMARLAEAGLVESVDGRWRTTQRGWLLGNEVFSAVWAGE